MVEESKMQTHQPIDQSTLHPINPIRVRGHLGVEGESDPSINDSLLQYDSPILAETASRSSLKKGPIDTKKQQALADVLNAILPPRTLIDDADQTYIQRVSMNPTTREQVIELQRLLDEKLQLRQARETGICPIREELYSQMFDEIIREITILSPERGLLLLRVRDEMRLSLSAYQCLFSSSQAFGLRKCTGAEIGRQELIDRVAELEASKLEAINQCNQSKALFESIERRIAAQRQVEDKKMQDEKEFLKYQQGQLETFLKAQQSGGN